MEEAEIFRQLRGNIFQPLLPKFQEDPKLWHLREEAGHTPLHWAALSGDVPFTTAALQHLEVDIRADNLQTPLMWAVTRGRLQVAKLLMEAKADPYTKDSVGATPLILAVQHGQTSAMLLLFALCEHKALLAGVDVKGCSAVHWAAFKGELSALQLLDYFNADFSVTDNEKMSPLHRAAQGNQDGIMQFLLDRGVNASLVDRQDRTCIEVAQQLNRQKALSRLKRLLEPKPSDEEGSKVLRRRKAAEEAEALVKRAKRMALPSFWFSCVSVATFEYLVELQGPARLLLPNCATAFELGVPVVMVLFLIMQQTDPGKVPRRVKGSSAVEELLRALRQPGEVPDCSRLCTTTLVLKDLRWKYCKHTDACIVEFDHFCGWLNTAIGRGNHRLFMLLVFLEFSVQWLHLAMLVTFLHSAVSADTYSAWFYQCLQYPLVCFVIFMHSVSSAGISFLWFKHLQLIAVNLTTNEEINLRRYDHFWQVKDGQEENKVYKNPFNKGSYLRNCMDFWWFRRRSLRR